MMIFECQQCGNAIHFENTQCVECGNALGYLPDQFRLTVVKPDDGGLAASADPSRRYALCLNAQWGVCNWLVPADGGAAYCLACRHNQTIPDLSAAGNAERWRKLENAKHALFYSLMRLRLPVQGLNDPARRPGSPGLAFDFIADATEATGKAKPAMTGHKRGVITINIAEADDAERERRRVDMGEPYRSLLGHFRHEIGHYYWSLLVDGREHLAPFRAVFGDERADYGEALTRYYACGPPTGWPLSFVSAYAAAHPWEDFAETWAHYLHIVDGLETARSFGITIRPRISLPENLETDVPFDPYAIADATHLLEAWVPLTVALNAVNRSVGQPDLYPFVLSVPAAEKLRFVHSLVRATPG